MVQGWPWDLWRSNQSKEQVFGWKRWTTEALFSGMLCWVGADEVWDSCRHFATVREAVLTTQLRKWWRNEAGKLMIAAKLLTVSIFGAAHIENPP